MLPLKGRLRVWREFALALLALLVLCGIAAWYWLPGAAVPGSGTGDPSISLDERWTPAESQRLAQWKVARTGLPSAGPPPAQLSQPPQARTASQPSTVTRARSLFNQASATLSRVRASAASDEEEGLPRLDSARAELLLEEFDRAQSGLYESGRAMTGYNRALVYLWSGAVTPARTALDSAGCLTEAPPAALNRRGLHVGCLWLRGRIAEAAQAGSGIADLAAAVGESLKLRGRNEELLIFRMRRASHLLDVDTADLWRDYLSALLARPDAKPLDEDRDSRVFELAQSQLDLAERPELTAMLKMLLARQGKFSLMKKLPGLGPEADESVRQLSMVADVAGGVTADDGGPGLSSPADAAELRNWRGHGCRRSQALGMSGNCAEATGEFAVWEETWREDLQDNIEGRAGWGGWLLKWFGTVAVWFLILFALWALAVTWRLGRRREALYLSKFRAHHFEESSRRAARSVKPKLPSIRDD